MTVCRSASRASLLSLALLVILLSALTASPAVAVEPPPLGEPIDHFAGRHPIGEQGALTLGDATANTPLVLRRLTLRQAVPPGDPAPPAETVNPPELTTATQKFSKAVTDGPIGFTEADLDQVAVPGGGFMPSREPGLLVAGSGITTAVGCSGAGFCLTWFRPTYDADHKFSSFDPGGQLAVSLGATAPEAGTDIAVATGTFDEAEGESVVVAWVHKPASGDREIRFAHVVAQRNAAGRISGLQLDGAVQTLGTAYHDFGYGTTSPAIAVGDFSGSGLDQAAVVWGATRSTPTAARLAATLLGAGAGAGLQTAIATQTFDAAADSVFIPGAGSGQVGPGAAAVHDIRDADSPVDRLIVAPGVSGARYLYRLEVGSSFTVQKLDGPDFASPGPFEPATYMTSNSELESLGDLDGDGIDELLATPFMEFNPDSTMPAGTSGPCDFGDSGCGHVEILDFASAYPELGEEFGVDSSTNFESRIESAVIDARPTKDQRIAPPPGSVDVGSLPQVAITGYDPVVVGLGFDGEPFLTLASINASEGFVASSAKIDLGAQDTGFNPERRPPQVAAFTLDGQVELGDPVQDGYRSLEPSVVLNAPPTHFDILDGEAYDPNFCYAGNQYEGACAFESEYERASSTSTEVSTESSEDWAVSATVTADADFGVAQLGAELRSGYGENFTKVNGSSETETVTVNVKARNTDKIYAMRRAYDTLEYPLYQPGSGSPDEFLLATTPHTLSQRWIDSSSPDATEIGVNHQPGNILSYPEDLSTAENPFISPTEGTDSLTKTTFGRDEFELSDSSDYSYTLTRSKVDADSAATTKSWNVGATISGGGGIGFVSVSAEVSGDYSSSDLSTVATTIGDDTSLISSMGSIDESFGETAYTVKPFAYWTDNAALVLDYAVEPSIAPPGQPKTWWQQQYGVRPDLTLNLPRLLDFEEQAGITSDAARFISPGVRVLEGPCSSPAPLDDDSTAPGEPLCLVAQVENYSLKDGTTTTDVDFYDADPDLGGRLIGTDSVPAVAARDHATAKIDWTPDLRYAGTTPRIFAAVEAGDTVREIHEDNNKGFRAYEALPSSTAALHPAEDVIAEVGADESSIDVEWGVPSNLSPHVWLVRAYPDDGGAPTSVAVAGNLTSASIPIPAVGRYRVVVFATNGADSSAASHPAEPVDVGVASSGGTSVAFVEAPEEGGYTGPAVDVSFLAAPSEATTECVVDGEPRPCRSPLRLGGLEAGSHTIQVNATSGGATASTEMIAWTVDATPPTVELDPIERLSRRAQQLISYEGTDDGGSGLAGYEVEIRRAGPRGEFTDEPVLRDYSAEPERESAVSVAPGETVCVAVRALDGAGNTSPWSAQGCTTRQLDASALRKDGGWKRVDGGEFSDGHALRATGKGSALLYELDRTSKVRVLAGRCRACGKLAIEVNGRRTKVIDLGETKRRQLTVAAFDTRWTRRQDGRLRLVSLGGGPVVVDGLAAWRTSD